MKKRRKRFYSLEEKRLVINEYLKGKGSRVLSREFLMPRSTILLWIKRFKIHGESGLVEFAHKRLTSEEKAIIEHDIIENSLSLSDASVKYRIGPNVVAALMRESVHNENPTLNANSFEDNMNKKTRQSSKTKTGETSPKEVQDLIKENKRLKAEVAYLKKLRALVQERTLREKGSV